MTYFINSGTKWKPYPEAAIELQKTMPGGNYAIRKDPFDSLYFETLAPFTVPAKLYGDVTKHTQRIITTFLDRAASTGVLLSGEQGSGKTLLAKNISYTLAQQGVPTFIIAQPWHGEMFNALIQSISQPAVIMFDEFEKVYKREEQMHLLTLLDGVFSSKKLFLLTCNDEYSIDTRMKNRPGRIFYLLRYKGLPREAIIEYCEENLNNKEHVEAVALAASMFNEFNFDMLKALVEDMNRYGEHPAKVLELLNASPREDGSPARFAVRLFLDEQEVPDADMLTKTVPHHPLSAPFEVCFYEPRDPELDEAETPTSDLHARLLARAQARYRDEIEFEPEHFVQHNPRTNEFVFKKEDATVVLRRVAEPRPNYFNY
jgi:hypothetical protein